LNKQTVIKSLEICHHNAFAIKGKSARTRACTHLPMTVVKFTFTYYVWLYVQS